MNKAALGSMVSFRQWICWRLETVPGIEKPQKIPYNPVTGRRASSVDPAHWVDFETASNAAQTDQYVGAGFVFTEQDPFFFADFDNQLQPDGSWSPLVMSVVARFPGCMMEVSQSSTGLHLVGMCAKPLTHRTRPHLKPAPNIELYTKERFIAFNPSTVPTGDADTWSHDALVKYIEDYFTKQEGEHDGSWTTEPVADWRGPEDDDELIRRAIAASSRNAGVAFGDQVGFKDLWENNEIKLSRAFPGRSEIDQALANHLAFWTGKNCERMERLMRQSALVRSKWDVHATYLEMTILGACRFVHKVYQEPVKETPPPPPPPPPIEDVGTDGFEHRICGGERMLPHEQLAFFSRCTYVMEAHAIAIPDGRLLDKSRFDVLYGGVNFVTDKEGKPKSITTSAFDAFTQNEHYRPPMVDRLAFRPDHPVAAVIQEGNIRVLNSYRPDRTLQADGDPTKFLDFMAKLLPDKGDRDKIIFYIASMLQNIGVKFQWWPVLQGTKGNGKTAILELVTRCIGEDFTHMVNVAKMQKGKSDFNGWVDGKLFLGFEEVWTTTRRMFLEEIKTLVTNTRIAIEKKRVDEITGRNYANGIMTTNHKDGVQIDDDERRYGVAYTAQQSYQDLVRDGMTGNYFPDLYDWLRGTGVYSGQAPGWAIMNKYLRELPIPAELDPAKLLTRAPQFSQFKEVLANSRGQAEMAVLDAIDEGRKGFQGGWISSSALNALWEGKRINVPSMRRRDVLRSLGYDVHPGLQNDGKAPRFLTGEATRSRLYVQTGHLSLNLTDPEAICAAFEKAQAQSGGIASEAKAR